MRARLFFGRAATKSGRAGRIICAAAALILLGLTQARADIQDPNAPHAKGARQQRREVPANGVPISVTIEQGASVEIVLRARGQLGKWMDFSIHSQPEHGVLEGPLHQLSRNTAAVTYTHRADDGPGQDTFSYSVQAAGSAVSAPALVKIFVNDTPPALVATPAELDFGAVKVGDTSGADLVLENRGGGEAIGRLNLPSPWIVDGPADYRLGRGERQSFHVLFGPKSGRSFSETIFVAAGSGAPAHLLGTGLGAPGEPDASGSNGAIATRVATLGPASGIGGIDGAGGAAGIGPDGGLAVKVTPAAAAEAPPPRLGVSGKAAAADPMQGMPAPGDDTVGPAPSAPLDSSGFINLADTGVKQFKLRRATRSTLDVSWKPLAPIPKLYRIELRYLAADNDGKLRIDWRPYAQVDIRTSKDLCLATVRRLPAGARQTLRVVAMDAMGRVAGGSATLQAATLPASDFWRVTPLRILIAALLLCLGLVVRRRWEERQMWREVEESRAARAASSDYSLRH
jgi:hypothetical protein